MRLLDSHSIFVRGGGVALKYADVKIVTLSDKLLNKKNEIKRKKSQGDQATFYILQARG